MPQSGQPIASDFRDMVNALRASRIVSVRGGKLQESPNGTTIVIDKPKPPVSTGSASPHPWKVTANGNNTVSIAPGCMLGFLPDMSSSSYGLRVPMVAQYISYAGGNVTVAGSTGYIYAEVQLTSDVEKSNSGSPDDNLFDSYLYRPYGGIYVFWSDESPDALTIGTGDNFLYFPLAVVSLADDVASVEMQILTHNPLIQLNDIPVIDHPYS